MSFATKGTINAVDGIGHFHGSPPPTTTSIVERISVDCSQNGRSVESL